MVTTVLYVMAKAWLRSHQKGADDTYHDRFIQYNTTCKNEVESSEMRWDDFQDTRVREKRQEQNSSRGTL